MHTPFTISPTNDNEKLLLLIKTKIRILLYGLILDQTAAKGHVRVHGPIAVRVRIDVWGTCCHQVP